VRGNAPTRRPGDGPAGRLEVQMNFTREGGDQFDLPQQIVDNARQRYPRSGQLAVVSTTTSSARRGSSRRSTADRPAYQQTRGGWAARHEAEELRSCSDRRASGEHGGPSSRPSGRRWADSRRAGCWPRSWVSPVSVFPAVIYRVLGWCGYRAVDLRVTVVGFDRRHPDHDDLPGIAASCSPSVWRRTRTWPRGSRKRSAAAEPAPPSLGYGRGFKAILDGNLTTITAFILFALSSGSVRGFVVPSCLGVLLVHRRCGHVRSARPRLRRGFGLSAGMMGVF